MRFSTSRLILEAIPTLAVLSIEKISKLHLLLSELLTSVKAGTRRQMPSIFSNGRERPHLSAVLGSTGNGSWLNASYISPKRKSFGNVVAQRERDLQARCSLAPHPSRMFSILTPSTKLGEGNRTLCKVTKRPSKYNPVYFRVWLGLGVQRISLEIFDFPRVDSAKILRNLLTGSVLSGMMFVRFCLQRN